MPWPVHPNGLLGAQGDNDTYQISRSLRFNSADSAYLNRTPLVAGNRKTWTWSGWVKRSKLSSTGNLFSNSNGASGFSAIRLENTDTLDVFDWTGSAMVWHLSTTQLFRDPSAWYHILVAVDTSQGTASNRVRIYINGIEITSFSTATYPTQNSDTYTNMAQQAAIGSTRTASNSEFFEGYLTEINFIDGQALTPSSFGKTDAITGRWKAKAFSGTYGTNGFYLKFADNSSTAALGTDSSGNGNTWTTNNFSVTAGADNDSLVDSPTNYGSDTGVGGELRGNYATLNPLWNYASTISNGNMDWATSTVYGKIAASFAVNSGKWYWEVTGVTVGYIVGIVDASSNPSAGTWAGTRGYYSGNGNKYLGDTASSYASSFAAGDVIGCALDMDNGTLVFYKNNTSQGTAFTGISGFQYPCFLGGDGNVGLSAVINTGKRPFAYTAPTGFKALCTTNLIKATAITTSGSFIGNVSANGPFVYLNGIPTAMTINGNAVTFGSQADRLSNGFKVRTTSTSYNSTGTNNFSVSTTAQKFKYARAQAN
jgi:hypothetical protein